MIDIHSHILYDVDDGCKNIEQSVETIQNLKKLGFNKIILTPHFIDGTKYCCDNETKIAKYKHLVSLVEQNNLDIKLYLGNEIYINYQLLDLIQNEQIFSMNKTRYLLIELPLYNEINNVKDYLYEIKLKGYEPIIAHPERYKYFQDNIEKMEQLYQSGVLFQSNYGSILGYYGRNAKKTVIHALKKNWITFMATDIHDPNFELIQKFSKATKKIQKIVGNEQFENITHNNAAKMLADAKLI